MPAPPREELARRLVAVPGMDTLLPALAGLSPSYLVGGAVRDLIRGEQSVDLDVAVDGDAAELARELARRLDGGVTVHERFGTATVRAQDVVIDIARTRRERYTQPGALPAVEPAGLEDDLRRRDFTVNAMALALSDGALGELIDPNAGSSDLDARLIRVMHQASFLDDPTRILRALHYASRLGFELEPETARLLASALQRDALRTVSGPRVRDELLSLLGAAEAPSAVERMRDLGVAAALEPALRPDPELVASVALGSVETGADRALAALAALCSEAPEDVEPFVERLDLRAPARDSVLRASRSGPRLARELQRSLRPSELHGLLAPEPPEALALALGLGAPAEPVAHFLADLRSVRLEVAGGDLLAAGVPQSPAIGRALRETLRRKLDGELSGREQELQAALELAREPG